MKLLATTLLIVLLPASSPAPQDQDQDPRLEMEVHETVVHFLELLGGLRFYALGQYMTEDANIITARWSRSGFVNRVQSGREWLDDLMEGPGPQPFREELTNVEIEVVSGELALVRADFEIVRDTGGGVVRRRFFHAGAPRRPVETCLDRLHVNPRKRTKPRNPTVESRQERLDTSVPAHRARIRVTILTHPPRQLFVRSPLI